MRHATILAIPLLLAAGGCAPLLTGHDKSEFATIDALATMPRDQAHEADLRHNRLASHFDNFGVVDIGVYRGAQPDLELLPRLRENGIVSIVNFRNEEDKIAEEAAAAEAAGLGYFSLPWKGKGEIKPEMIADFLAILDDSANLPVFVHCQRGAERTGTMIAVYRMERHGWTNEEAYAEMNRYRFRSMLYGNLKRFVMEYVPRHK